MPNDERLNDLAPAHRELENALRGLSPASVAISRDRLMFQAGAMIGRRSASRWRRATAALLVVNVGLMVFSARSPRETGSTMVVQNPAPALSIEPRGSMDVPTTWYASRPAASPTSIASAQAYVSLRDDVLQRGLSALPSSAAQLKSERPVTVDQLLETSPRPRDPASPWSPFSAPLRQYLFSGETL